LIFKVVEAEMFYMKIPSYFLSFLRRRGPRVRDVEHVVVAADHPGHWDQIRAEGASAHQKEEKKRLKKKKKKKKGHEKMGVEKRDTGRQVRT
jgi:hypothetical protein